MVISTRHVQAAALAAAVLSLAACKAEDPATKVFEWDATRARLTEQRLETLTEIARDLRDRSGGMPPAESLLEAEVRKRHPATGDEDVLIDGYGRPFRYTTSHEDTGHSVKNGFEFTSDGADPGNAADDIRRGATTEQAISGG